MTATFISWFQRSKTVIVKSLLLFVAAATVNAQENLLEDIPELRDQAVVMRIVSRIVEQNEQVVWNLENSRVSLPGRPVGLKLVGTNLMVTVQFTFLLQPQDRHILVAQGQIWINTPDEGTRYYTTIQTIPVVFNEQILFFPLGSMYTRDEASIEIQLVVEPYSAETFVGRGQGRGTSPRPHAENPERPDPPPRRWGNIGSP